MEKKEKEIRKELKAMGRDELEEFTANLLLKVEQAGLESMRAMNDLTKEKVEEKRELLSIFKLHLKTIKSSLKDGNVNEAIETIDKWLGDKKE